MTGRELAARLTGAPVADVPAVRLLLELEAHEPAEVEPNLARLVEMQPDIQAALDDLERRFSTTRGLRRRCLSLSPIPSWRVPAGL